MHVLSGFLHSLAVVATLATDGTRCARALSIARRSKCPSSTWKDALAPLLWPNVSFTADAPLVYANAGANKGFAVAEFLQRFHNANGEGGLAPSNREWHRSIKQIKPSGMFGCGMCSACKDPYPHASVRRNVSVRVYAFELLKPNYWLLSKLFARYRVPGAAYHAAVSNYSGTAYAPTGVRTGQEWTSAELGEPGKPEALHASAKGVDRRGSSRSGSTSGGSSKRARSKAWAAVESLTLDAFAAREGIQRIHWLSIDAEGWDALILEGTAALLESQRVDLLEFEVCTESPTHSDNSSHSRPRICQTLILSALLSVCSIIRRGITPLISPQVIVETSRWSSSASALLDTLASGKENGPEP